MNIQDCCLVALTVVMCGTLEVAYAETSNACDLSVVGIADASPPAELAAILNYDCAADYLDKNPDIAAGMAINMGYPSLLLEHTTDAQAIELMETAAADGDRGFFADDPEILYNLEELDVPYTLLAFVRTATGSSYLNEAENSAAYLERINLWKSPVNARLLTRSCAKYGCEEKTTTCPSEFGMADKMRIAAGDIDLYESIALCDISPEWIISLRRAGVVDTSCTSIMQINAALQDPGRLPGQCLESSKQLSGYNAIGSTDYSRYIRRRAASGDLLKIDRQSIDMIGYIFPETANYLITKSSESLR